MVASRSRRASADRVHAMLFIALSGLSRALVFADASADACPAPIAITRREGDGETLVATLGREAPCAPIEAPLMRRVAVSGIRLEVRSRRGANAGVAPAAPPVRVRVASGRGNFLSLTSAESTLAAARHPLARGDGVLDQTVEFIAAPSVASTLLASLEYVNVDMGMLGGAGADADAESAANRTRFPAAACAAPSARRDAIVVEVFATETDARPSATLRARVARRGGSPFPRGTGTAGTAEGDGAAAGGGGSRASSPEGVALASAFSASRGSLRSTPVLVATCATLAFVVVCSRAAVRACCEGSEANGTAARGGGRAAAPREASATARNRA